jgi:hypothetical protein
MFESRLYRADQASFLLYPEKRLPGFMERNVVPPERVTAVPLLAKLVRIGDDTLIVKDAAGTFRFAAGLRNEDALERALDALAAEPVWSEAVARDRDEVAALYEDVFEHSAYTGRSGAMYAYEGVGSVYWHMVAKLLVAVQEVFLRAEDDGTAVDVLDELADLYHRVRAGLGFEKTPEEYGAFPTDPYSHTPPGGGAKQPGMTGQVKEEILTRWGELGVRVEGGAVSFRPSLLRSEEFLRHGEIFEYFDVHGASRTFDLPEGTLAFTYCQVPVVYERAEGTGRVRVEFEDGTETVLEGCALDRALSAELLGRTGRIADIRVAVTRG